MTSPNTDTNKLDIIMSEINNLYDNYLNNVNFVDPIDKRDDFSQLKRILISDMFKEIKFDKILTDINDEIKKMKDKIDSITNDKCSSVKKNKLWLDCKDSCQDTLSKFLNMEINSTAYILRVIAESYIPILTESNKNNCDDNPTENLINKSPLKFSIKDFSKINLYLNKENELQNIGNQSEKETKSLKTEIKKMESYFNWNEFKKDIIIDFTKSSNSRLIMGFGPSASGKTYCAQSIIKIMSIVESNFPKIFMTIDGGIFREESILYLYIIKLLNLYKLGGFNNMKLSGFSIINKFTNFKSLFDSSKIKKILYNFLLEQKETYNKQISLYIPETLGKCINNCKKEYSDYFKICPKENWIGLYIYQHKYKIECEYSDNYVCEGTTYSGKKREIKEGKKYSNKAYEKSEYYGIKEMLSAPYAYKIHNSGRNTGINIIEDYSIPDRQINIKIIKDNPNSAFNFPLYKFITGNEVDDNLLKQYRYIKIDKNQCSNDSKGKEDEDDDHEPEGRDDCIPGVTQSAQSLVQSEVSYVGGSSENSVTNNFTNNTYYQKYLKYKQKYLELKKFSK